MARKKSPRVAIESRPSRKARILIPAEWPSDGESEAKVFSAKPAMALPEARTLMAKMASTRVTARPLIARMRQSTRARSTGRQSVSSAGSSEGLDGYPKKALARIWKAERFSWWMTQMLHRFPESTAFDQKMQTAELDYLFSSNAAQTALAENYVGLPY